MRLPGGGTGKPPGKALATLKTEEAPIRDCAGSVDAGFVEGECDVVDEDASIGECFTAGP